MARKTTARVKPSGGRKTRAATSTAPQHCKPIPRATLSKLKKLVAKHRSNELTASWELGRLAREILNHTETSPAHWRAIADLGEQVGMIESPDSAAAGHRHEAPTLRQLMKFSRLATSCQAAELTRARLPWRGVVFWMGVSNRSQRHKLYSKMVTGLTNSTEIEKYIETSLKRKPLPRFSGNRDKDFRKAQDQTESFTRFLGGLCLSLDKHEARGSVQQRRQLRKSLENAKTQISATMRKLR